MDKTVSNQDIIRNFKKAAATLDVIQDNFFRVRAYQNAIEAIQNLDEELVSIYKRGELDNIPGIGKELSSKIGEIIQHGSSAELEELFSKVPQGMFPLLNIPGVGPKRAHQLSMEFELDDPEEAVDKLKNLAQKGEVAKLEGFGKRSEEKLLKNIQREKPKQNRMLIDKADQIALKLVGFLEEIEEVEKAEVMGSLRRRRETIGDVDIGIATKDPDAVAKKLEQYQDIASVQALGTNVIRVVLVGNKQVDIKFSPLKKFGSMLQHFTGSKLHNIALRELAIKKDMSLSEHGIKDKSGTLEFEDEKKFYNHLGLKWIPPELRENTGEVEAAQKSSLPALVTLQEIKGELHTHTNYDWVSSHDYGAPIKDLLSKAQGLGLEWIALGDHNPSNNEYKDDEIIEHIKKRSQWIDDQYSMWKEDVKNSSLKILKTLEVDIKPDGSLAIPKEALDHLDFILVSIHSAMDLTSLKQTDRITKALSHKKAKILAHPTARLLTKRPGINARWSEVFECLKEKHKAIEINANPRRLDLPDSLVKQAVKNKVAISIGTDAHEVDQLNYLRYGVDVARRGWVQKNDIINTKTHSQLKQWLKK